MLWRFGNVRSGYVSGSPSNSGSIRRLAGTGLQVAGRALGKADAALASPSVLHRADNPEQYAEEFMQAVDLALTRARGVVVALSPAESPMQSTNAAAVTPRLEARAARVRNLRLVTLGDEPLLLDPTQRLDGWNYGGDAIAAAARKIAPAVIDLVAAADRAGSSR